MNPQGASTVAAGIAGTGVSAALTTLICWGLSLVGVQVPGEAAAAIGALLATCSHHFLRNQETTVSSGITIQN